MGDATPMHDMPLQSGEWWACSHPERPADHGTTWDERCPSCMIAAQAAEVTNGVGAIEELDADRVVVRVWPSLAEYQAAREEKT